jgi:ABC-2 type transport system permease protein
VSSVGQLWTRRGLIANLTQRELKVKYKRSVLGWLWSLINPASTLLIYTVVFGVFLRVRPPVAGNGETESFALFLFTGLVVWGFFTGTIHGSMNAVTNSRGLLQNVALPPACPPIAATLATVIQTAIETVILVGVLVLVGNLGPTALLFPFVVGLLLLFSLGVALVLSLLNAHYRDVGYLVGIALSLGFYLTPIIYPFSRVPEEVAGVPVRTIVRLNPMTQFVGVARDLLYYLQLPSAGRLIGLTLASFATFAVGWAIFAARSSGISEAP